MYIYICIYMYIYIFFLFLFCFVLFLFLFLFFFLKRNFKQGCNWCDFTTSLLNIMPPKIVTDQLHAIYHLYLVAQSS